MRQSRFTEEEKLAIVREHVAGARAANLCRRHRISGTTLSNWRSRFEGVGISELRRLRVLDSEVGELKRLLAESVLENARFRALLPKSF